MNNWFNIVLVGLGILALGGAIIYFMDKLDD